MNLTQRHLRMVVTTAAFANITRAAEALHVSQPALTRALLDFERQLGTPLFRRTTRRLALTAEGERFLPTAQRLLNDMERALDDLHAQSRGLEGSVTLAVGIAYAATVLPPILVRFRVDYPGIQVRLVTDNSAGITARVARSEADLGIGTPIGDTAGLALEPLLTASLGLLGDPKRFALGTHVSARTLPVLPLLKDAADTSMAHLLRMHGSALVARMHRGIEVSDLAVQLALAHAGVGVAVVSALGASHPQAAGLRFAPLRPAIRRELFLMRPQGQARTPSAAALATALTAHRDRPRLHRLVKFAIA